MKLLVTGGLGVNGIWVVRDLLSHGHDPVIIDRRKDFSLAPDLEHAVNTVVADITDIERLTRTMQEERIECVIHLAALMPTESQIDPRVG
ncbi:MAG: NAD-dependent epimerase/dehydratase family protein, partial [Actinomycetota bacterium]